MRKLLLAFASVALLAILFGGVLVRTSDASRSANTCSDGSLQTPGTRCVRFQVPKRKPKPKKQKSPAPPLSASAMADTRCMRLREDSWHESGIFPNDPPSVELKTSVSEIVLSCKAGETSTTCTTDGKVQLTSVGSDPDGDKALYTYSVTGGRISGDGTQAVWDLSGVEPGSYIATVEMDDGCGCLAFTSVTMSVEACPDCEAG
jgi:hypothetical protein